MNNSFILSITNPTETERSATTEIQLPAADETVALDDILKQVFKEEKIGLQHLQAIVRCDALPQVAGSASQLTSLIRCIIKMILNHPPDGTKLFLYVKCSKARVEDEQVKALGFSTYEINFHTNIRGDEHWQRQYAGELAACHDICQGFAGSLVVHPITNTGCLFTVTLPGKIN